MKRFGKKTLLSMVAFFSQSSFGGELEVLVCHKENTNANIESVYFSTLVDSKMQPTNAFASFRIRTASPRERTTYRFTGKVIQFEKINDAYQLRFSESKLVAIGATSENKNYDSLVSVTLTKGQETQATFEFSDGSKEILSGCDSGALAKAKQIKLPVSPPPLLRPTPPVRVDTSLDVNSRIFNLASEQLGSAFKPGQTKRCMDWVRHVLSEACGSHMRRVMTSRPWDVTWTAPLMANSLAGSDVGLKVSRSELKPGDLVFFVNTYGNFRRGTITHVGIFEGGKHYIHRPTAARPVSRGSLNASFIGGVRLSATLCEN